MPEDVMIVVGDPGDGRVPEGSGGCFDVVRRLKADILPQRVGCLGEK